MVSRLQLMEVSFIERKVLGKGILSLPLTLGQIGNFSTKTKKISSPKEHDFTRKHKRVSKIEMRVTLLTR